MRKGIIRFLYFAVVFILAAVVFGNSRVSALEIQPLILDREVILPVEIPVEIPPEEHFNELFPTPTGFPYVCALACPEGKVFQAPCNCIDLIIEPSPIPTPPYVICQMACPPGTSLQPPCECVPNPVISVFPVEPSITPTPIKTPPYVICERACPPGSTLQPPCECVLNPVISPFPIKPEQPVACMRACPLDTILTHDCQCVPENKPKKDGTVVFSAYTRKDNRKIPYQGVFLVCEEPNITDEYSEVIIRGCYSLQTNNAGHGSIKLPAGWYKIHPPQYCPPGANCLMDLIEPEVIIRDLWLWKFSPSDTFLLSPRQVLHITAISTACFLF